MTKKAKSLLNSLIATRVARGSIAMLYGQAVQVIVQFATIPIMVGAWGLVGYGQWLALFTLPALLAVGDVGLSAATGNAMITAAAQDHRGKAAKLNIDLQTVLRTICVSAVLCALGLVILLNQFIDRIILPGRSAAIVVVALVVYAMLGVFTSGIMAGYRAADQFASSNFVLQNVSLAESVAALITCGLGGTALDVALAYVAVRLIGTVFLTHRLRVRAPWLHERQTKIDWVQFRPLLVPAVSTLPLPVAYAVTMQGAVLAISWSVGPAMIPAFVATRTLTRTALQICNSVSFASMPQYTAASARNDEVRRDQILFANIAFAILLLIPVAIVIAWFGDDIISIWTNNRIYVNDHLLMIMLASMLCSGVWMPISNMILALNRPALYTWFFLITACIGTVVGVLLSLKIGVTGAAIGVLTVDVAMVFWVIRKANAVDIINIIRQRAKLSAWYTTALRASKQLF